jgi:hypothetical protein
MSKGCFVRSVQSVRAGVLVQSVRVRVMGLTHLRHIVLSPAYQSGYDLYLHHSDRVNHPGA